MYDKSKNGSYTQVPDNHNIVIRDIISQDIDNGFLESLDSLRTASSMDKTRARSILSGIENDPNHIIAVASISDMVVGTATLLIEQKFIHNGGLAGHIEDVAVATKYRGKGIGSMIVEYLLAVAYKRGCYRTTLDCQPYLIPFYTKMGFRRHADTMRYDHN